MATPSNLSDLTYMTAVELKSVKEGLVTTAGATTFADSFRTETADYWNRGPAWIVATPTLAAPMGEFGIVLDYASGSVTLRSALSASAPIGATYALGRKRYTLDILIQQVNAAYRRLGKIPQIDVSLTTAPNTTEYDIPVAAQKYLREVYLQTKTGVAVDYGWKKLPYGRWREENGHLYLPQLTGGYKLKLVYVGEPATLAAWNNAISPYVHPNRIVFRAASNVILWRSERLGEQQAQALMTRVNALLDDDQRAEYDHPIHMPKRGNKILDIEWGREYRDWDDEPFMDVF